MNSICILNENRLEIDYHFDDNPRLISSFIMIIVHKINTNIEYANSIPRFGSIYIKTMHAFMQFIQIWKVFRLNLMLFISK